MNDKFSDISDESGSNHGTDVNRESHAGLGEEPGKNGSETDCNDELEYCSCIHVGMTLVFYLFFNQKAVIICDSSLKKVFLLNQSASNRTTNQASGDKSECRCGGTDCCSTLYVEVFENRSECSGGTVTTDHRDGTGTHTNQWIKSENR